MDVILSVIFLDNGLKLSFFSTCTKDIKVHLWKTFFSLNNSLSQPIYVFFIGQT